MSWTISTTDDGVTVTASGATGVDPGRFGVETLVVAGGSIDVAVLDETFSLDTSMPFSIRLHSPDMASGWLPYVIGDDATTAILHGESSESPFETGHLATLVQRFALGTWMQRWWVPADWVNRSSASPSEWMLDAELGSLAYDGADLFGSYGVADVFLDGVGLPLAEQLTVRSKSHMAMVAPRGVDVPPILARDRVASVLARAASAVLDRQLLPFPLDDVLAAAESDYWDIREGTTIVQTLAELQHEVVAADQPADWAFFMGTNAEDEKATAPIDPFDVHPRSLRAPSLSWGFAGSSLIVEIDSPKPGSVALGTGELFARVEVGGDTYAIALDPTERGYFGARRIDKAMSASLQDISVSVYSDRYSAGGRKGRSPSEVAATREILQRFAAARADRAAEFDPATATSEEPSAPFAVELKYLGK